MRLLEYDRDDRIFIDANIFIYNALDHPLYGDSCSNFLNRVECGLIDGVITTHVIDEVLFKILTAKASCYLDKTTIWDIKDKMKDVSFSKKVYSAVWKYADYLDELTSYGVTILPADMGTIMRSVELGEKYGLLTTDSIHLAAMMRHKICNIATNDSDFERVDLVAVWNP